VIGAPLLLAVVLLFANAFFVASEFALIAARRTQIEHLASEGNARARTSLGLMRELSLQLAGAQLGITMASLGLGFVAEPAVASVLESALEPLGLPSRLLHTVAFIAALSIVVFFHMVIGEMVPKNVAIAAPERTLLWLSLPVRAYSALFRPIIRTLNALANLGLRLVRIEPRDELAFTHTAEELASMLAASRQEGLLEEFEHGLLRGALGFGERQVASIMVPRDRVRAIPRSATVAEAEEVVVATGHSRLIVYGRDIDDVLGFVHAKDLLRLPPSAREHPIPAGRIRRMLVVARTRRLEEVLVAMRRARVHLAVVVDPGGRTAGIVTLEDLLEELVGEIRDEHDPVAGPRGRRRRM
jgi:CBS domain containing-hemolysin-like protein